MLRREQLLSVRPFFFKVIQPQRNALRTFKKISSSGVADRVRVSQATLEIIARGGTLRASQAILEVLATSLVIPAVNQNRRIQLNQQRSDLFNRAGRQSANIILKTINLRRRWSVAGADHTVRISQAIIETLAQGGTLRTSQAILEILATTAVASLVVGVAPRRYRADIFNRYNYALFAKRRALDANPVSTKQQAMLFIMT